MSRDAEMPAKEPRRADEASRPAGAEGEYVPEDDAVIGRVGAGDAGGSWGPSSRS